MHHWGAQRMDYMILVSYEADLMSTRQLTIGYRGREETSRT